ncbi:MAG: hypothetical protein EA356_15570 [Geminicoccaceae bacterium]|nr:MAG: hypothetical protein EA356_15570 [Geminicoccaceae bacterium]
MTDALGLGSLNIDPNTNRVRMNAMSSGIDTGALVEALTDAKKTPAIRLERNIEVGEAKIAAYQDLRTVLGAMQNALDGLRNPPGFNSIDNNLFEKKEAYFSSNTGVQPHTLLGIQTTNRAELGRFDLEITSLATGHKVMSHSIADRAAPGLQDGTLTIGLGSGETADIAVTEGMTLGQLRDAINTQSATTGVRASILQVAEGDHRLVLTGQKTGTGQDIVVTGEAANVALLGLGEPTNQLSAAANAEFFVDGIPASRPTNTITDLYSGLTIDLYQADPNTKITIEVEPSYGAARDQLYEFVDAYNTLRDLIDSQNLVVGEGGVDRVASPLFGDSLLRSLGQSLGLAVGGSVAGLGAAPSTLGQLGITMGRDNRLEIDGAKLDQMLLTDPSAVRRVFEFDAQISSPDLAIFRRPASLPSNSFTIEKDAGDWLLKDGTNTLVLEATGNTLRAPKGSAYDGLTLFYVGQGDPTEPITITATQGLADRLHGLLERAVGLVDGSIDRAIEGTEQQIDTWRKDIERINARAEAYRDVLIERFGRLETALSLSESMLKHVRTQTDAMFARN